MGRRPVDPVRCKRFSDRNRGATGVRVPSIEDIRNSMIKRLFAIGDIHGCNVALRALIEAIEPRTDDTIVVLGDVIDWGPDSRDCVQQLIALSGQCQMIPILGNHEELLLQALESDSA